MACLNRGALIVGPSRQAFAAYIEADIAKWRGVIQAAGVKID